MKDREPSTLKRDILYSIARDSGALGYLLGIAMVSFPYFANAAYFEIYLASGLVVELGSFALLLAAYEVKWGDLDTSDVGS